ncbi:MAG: FIST N-terminal domain-containing protein [Planctomycetaceae bacterium]
MPYAAALSRNPDLAEATREVCDDVRSRLNGQPPDLSFCFVSAAYPLADVEELASRVVAASGSRVLLGCTAEGVAGGGEELESGPGLALWSAVLPECRVVPFQAEFGRTPDGIICEGLPEDLFTATDDVRAVFLLGDPFSSVPDSIVQRLAAERPGVALLGGMASAARRPGENRLFSNGDALDHGAVGAVLRGGPRVRSVVSQGCRPIGRHFVVTRGEQNVIVELGGLPPLAQLQELLPSLPARDQELASQGLQVGIVMNEYQPSFEQGDFLISNVVGVDREHGAIAIGHPIRTGQTVQFHVRDAQTAHDDLELLLDRDRAAHPAPPGAALLFTCNGRGTRLFPRPHHDARTIRDHAGPIPLAGYFAMGELGPVGDRNYVHGYTASIALFE